MLMRLSGEVAKVDGIGGTRDWLIAELSTVIAHAQDGPHERVLTLSEVKAKDEDLKWALNWINNEAKHLRERGEPQEALEVALNMILERHGIVLDPA